VSGGTQSAVVDPADDSLHMWEEQTYIY